MHPIRLAVVACCVFFGGCANAIVSPAVSPSKPASDALLVLPGFGYSRAGEHALRSLGPSLAAEGFDLYVPTYVARSGLEQSRERLHRFFLEHHLDRYERVHIFAFLAGGWTFNPLGETRILQNVASVVYDRSPYQERAPRVALEKLRFLTWLKYGPVVFDLARTPYVPLRVPGVKVGLVVETSPTSFIKRFAAAARGYGAYDFECEAFEQPHDDCFYVALSHDELYVHFPEVWPEVRSFIHTGQFSASANRTTPAGDAATLGGPRSVGREKSQ
jgi:hypothetical protein